MPIASTLEKRKKSGERDAPFFITFISPTHARPTSLLCGKGVRGRSESIESALDSCTLKFLFYTIDFYYVFYIIEV